jgi:hypothetical protein
MADPSKLAKLDVPKFDGTNYKEWSTCMHGLFLFAATWDIVNGTLKRPSFTGSPTTGSSAPTPQGTEESDRKEWDTKDQRFRGYMLLYTNISMHHYFKDGQTSHELWEEFKKDFESTGLLTRLVNFTKLSEIRFDDNTDMNVQIQKFLYAINELAKTGMTLDDSMKACFLLVALPKSYNTLVSAYIGTLPNIQSLTIANLIPKILEEERRRKSTDNSVSRITQTRRLDNNMKCKKCGKTNHTTEQHWNKPSDRNRKTAKSKNQSNDRQNQNNYQNNNKQGNKQGTTKKKGQYKKGKSKATVNTLEIDTMPVLENDDTEYDIVSIYAMRETKIVDWLIDSGASSHVTNDLSDFSYYRKATIPGICRVAGKGMGIQIMGEGTVIIDVSSDKRKKQYATLKNVLYIPNATARCRGRRL